MLTFAKPSQTYLGGGIGIDGPALTPVLTFRPQATVWLWLVPILPAFTFVLIFTVVFSFLEKWIETDCGENHRSLVKLANRAGYSQLREYLCGRVRLALGWRDGRYQHWARASMVERYKAWAVNQPGGRR